MTRVEFRLAVLSSFLLAGPAAADMFKCTDATGKLVYQHSPCRPAAPRPLALPPIESFARPSEYETILALGTYRRCARALPDFAAKTAASYQAWRAENAAAIARLEPQLARVANPQAEASQAAEAQKWSAAERAAKLQSCEDFASRTFQPLGAGAPAGGPSR